MRSELWVGLEVKSSHLRRYCQPGLEESDSQQSSLAQRRTEKQGSARLWGGAWHTGLLIPARGMWEQNCRPKASLDCIVSPDSKNKKNSLCLNFPWFTGSTLSFHSPSAAPGPGLLQV